MGIHYFFITLLILHFVLLGYRLLKPVVLKQKNVSRKLKNQSHHLIILSLAIIVTGISWIITNSVLSRRRADDFNNAKSILNQFNLSISWELSSIDKATRTMAGSPWILPALENPIPENLDLANSVLDRYRYTYNASVCYLLDSTGQTLTSSNRNAADSFTGKSYHLRSYYLQAKAGKFGYSFALGITSEKRGYYSSAPILDTAGDFVGAVVIKKEIDFIEKELISRNFTCLIDENGIIFLSSRAATLYRPLWPLSGEQKDSLTESNQFGTLDFRGLFTRRLTDGEILTFENALSFVNIIPTTKEGWYLFSLSRFENLSNITLQSILITLFLTLLLHLISVLIVHYKTQQGELVLRENEKLYHELLETLPQIIFTCDLEGNITYANKFGAAYFDFTKIDSKINPNMLRFIAPEDHEKARENLREMIKTHNHLIDEYKFIRKGGQSFIGFVHGIPVFCNDRLTGFRGFIADISRQKEKDAEKNKLNKLESIGILAGGLAHDFNNILASLSNGINYLELQFAEEHETRKLLSELGVAIKYGKNITHQLLTFSKGGTPIKETTSIPDLIRETADFVLSGSNCICAYLFADNIWPADIDQGQISQVIQNLCLNSVQAMVKGGIITIMAENIELDSGQYKTVPPGRYLRIIIEDSGCGISPDQLPKIFDPFFTTKSHATGLGLATVYSIIHKHNGYIFAESIPAEKTTFTIFLPVVNKTKPASSKAASIIHKGQGHILIMDDDNLVLHTCQKLLEYLGYTVTTTKNGSEALQAYSGALKSDQPFVAVIMDLTIKGGMGGKETLKELLRLDPQVKAIVSSGYSNDPVMSHYAQYGFSGVIGKPYRLDKMSSLLKDVIAEPQP